MSQPAAYTPSHTFISDSGLIPLFPGQAMDIEFQNIKATTDQIRTNLALIQRDDGRIANGVVTYDSLDPALTAGGIYPLSTWVTATAYVINQVVVTGGSLYKCLISHTSGVFGTDLAAARWTLLANLPIGPTGATGAGSGSFSAFGQAWGLFTGLTVGISGGIPYFSGTTAVNSSALLATNAIVVGGGAGNPPLTPATTPPTISSTGVLTVPNATDSTSLGTGAVLITGGLSVGGKSNYGGAAVYAASAVGGAIINQIKNTGTDAGATHADAGLWLKSDNFTNASWQLYTGVKHIDGVGDSLLIFNQPVGRPNVWFGPSGGMILGTTYSTPPQDGLLAGGTITALNATAIPAGGTTGAGYKFSSTANFGIFFGSGVPTLSAGKGSLYLRSDGAINARVYVNTDGGTTWSAWNTAS